MSPLFYVLKNITQISKKCKAINNTLQKITFITICCLDDHKIMLYPCSRIGAEEKISLLVPKLSKRCAQYRGELRMKVLSEYKKMRHPVAQEALYALLEIKDSDIRLDTVYQGNHAVDKGIHIGGSFSELIPLITLFYGGFIHVNVEDPTARESDIYVQSKGHGVAGMASIFADYGFFDRKLLENSRGRDSDLNGHPGPVLPGVHIATGPLGQGVSAAVGFALAQKIEGIGKTFCLVGDGELQEGIPWEAFMFAAAKNLNNLCIIIDHNYGQNDDPHRLSLPMGDLKEKMVSFGFDVLDVNGREYGPIYVALEHFLQRTDSRPMVIISECRKGEGGFTKATESHKTTMKDDIAEWEIHQQEMRRTTRIKNFCKHLEAVKDCDPEEYEKLLQYALDMGIEVYMEDGVPVGVKRCFSKRRTRRAAPREKALQYRQSDLPNPQIGESYQCSSIAENVVAAFSRDPHMVTLDADMGMISGLQPGMQKYAENRGINVGIAESHMSGVAEAFAAKGYNVWHSTFGVFYDWRVLRRITVSQQERLENIAREDGWLSEGHGLDITLFSTASNIDTSVNGATHMSIDDVTAFMQLPHIRVIDVACPRLMVAVMKWIAEGGKGIVLLRLTRSATRTIYPPEFCFEYGKGYVHGTLDADTVLITSGRGIYEGLAAQKILQEQHREIAVVDMPSFDAEMTAELTKQGKRLVFAEQNNGFLFASYLDEMYARKIPWDPTKLLALSTRGVNRKIRHLHSATYEELATLCKVSVNDIVQAIKTLEYEEVK